MKKTDFRTQGHVENEIVHASRVEESDINTTAELNQIADAVLSYRCDTRIINTWPASRDEREPTATVRIDASHDEDLETEELRAQGIGALFFVIIYALLMGIAAFWLVGWLG